MSLRSALRSIIVAGSLGVYMAVPAYAAEYVSVNKDNVNVRTGPSTKNPVYMELFAGYPLKVTQRSGEWAKISDFEGDSGWIHNSLIGKNDTVIINAKESVNMRSGPSTTSPVVADVERGVIMKKIGEKGKWLQVRHSGGTVGWIYKPLLWP
ncbi:SH3 domain-containing protein [Desulfopila sp. IMCC35008]|uniref:SH3 domain-containing protein n=1 Tax=Desulfopila sp. IMCC35008 TaxID=2653858 RepID=UPI0013D00837|nr:SH3 domain-containing protein [Desulfopila sp. IMCC35008]